jgi:hypothetical protein
MTAVGWIITTPPLVLVLAAALAPGDDTPRTPRRTVLLRHTWQKMLREEEREGVRKPRVTKRPSDRGDRTAPQARWSDRR